MTRVAGLMSGLVLALLGSGTASAADSARVLIQEKGCLTCHSLHGEGGKLAPPLEAVYQWSNVDRVTTYIRDPKSVFQRSVMPGYALTEQELRQMADYIMGLGE